MNKLMNVLLLVLASAPYVCMSAPYTGHGADSIPAEVIKKFAPQPLEPALSRRIQQMFDIRSPGLGQVTPDGKKLFFSWKVTGASQVWRLDGPNTFPIQMTGGEDRTSLVDILPNGKKLMISRDRSGEENPGIYWQDIAGGALNKIFHEPKVQARFAFASADSRRVYFTANDVKPDSYALYRHDLESGKTERIFDQDGLWAIVDQRSEDELLLAKRTGSLWSEYFVWKTSSKELIPVVGQNEKEEYEVQFGARPGEFLVLTPKFGEFRRLYVLANGKYKPITPEISWDISDFKIDEARKRIYYNVNEAGYTRLYAIDGKSLKPLGLPEFKYADHVYIGTLSRDGDLISLGMEAAQAPRTAFVYNWKTKKLTQWVVPSAPEADLKKFVPARLEFYLAEDGTKIPMFVRRPPHCEKTLCPVIVEFHGGPESQTQPFFSPVAQLFLDAGFILAEPNVRGSDGYGKTWLNSDNGAKRLTVVTDIRDASNYIRKNWAMDGKAPKIGVYGGSYGGYSAQVAMSMFAGSYDAGFSEVGISNLLTFLKNTAPYRRLLRVTEYGDPEKDAEALKKLSPTSYVDNIKAPLFLVQGLNDPRVPVGEAIQMYETLKKKKVETGLVIFPDEGHGAGKRSNQVLSTGYAIEFFSKHLK
jgi:dipeptidyl aminopeptidase/acylaminoacyl peptidase